jgi:hypothetical protein
MDDARQHQGHVAQRLATGDLHLVAAQHHWVAAEFGHTHLERNPRTS